MKNTPLVTLSWEKSNPKRSVWSSQVYSLIKNELFDNFNNAHDAKRFCPNYANLSDDQKATVWSELISAISYYESGWSPTSRMKEEKMGQDPITKQPVYSEGLMQLSYQDVQWAPYCKFDWEKDKTLTSTDPNKTILNPQINLDCGVRILGNQIHNKMNVILSSEVYWAVLRDGGSYQKIDEITSMTKKLQFCRLLR